MKRMCALHLSGVARWLLVRGSVAALPVLWTGISWAKPPVPGISPEEVLTTDSLADSGSAERFAEFYVSWEGLGRFREGRIKKDAKPVIERLEELLQESPVDIVPILIEALQTIGFDPITGASSNQFYTLNLGPNAKGKEWPGRVLKLIEGRAEPEHAEAFSALLLVPDHGVVRWAADQVARLADDDVRRRVVEQLVAEIGSEHGCYARVSAMHAYMRLRKGDVEPVVSAVSDPDWLVRSHAIRLLAEHRIRAGKDAISRALQDPDVDVRLEAARALYPLAEKEVPFPPADNLPVAGKRP